MEDSVSRVTRSAQLGEIGEDLRGFGPLSAVGLFLRNDLASQVVTLVHAGNSVLLRGVSGAGKTALAKSLGHAIWPSKQRGQLQLIESRSPVLNCPPLIATTPSRFIDGCYYTYNLENKMNMLLKAALDKQAILFIDTIDDCMGMGASTNDPTNDVANLLLPYMERGLRVIGATTPDGEARMRALNPRLHSRFVTVEVPPPEGDEARQIARIHTDKLARSGARIDDDVVETGCALARRYLPGEPEVSVFLRLARRAAAEKSRVNAVALRHALAAELGVLPAFTGADAAPSFWGLREQLAAEVFAQDEAVTEVADALVRFSTGLADLGRPIASLLFAGPSGCGKTSLALAAAKALTGRVDQLVRFDMSEYSDVCAPKRLTDDSESSLVSRLRARSGGVLLLDEIEKAHQSVVQLLLQALGEARLTSQGGRTARLDSFMCVLTTNVGSRRWKTSTNPEKTVPLVLSDVAEEFLPEFLGRMTRTVVFRPLDSSAAAAIVSRELAKVNDLPGLVDRGLQLVWTEVLVDALAGYGLTPQKGARGLQGVVRGILTTPLARWLSDEPTARDGLVMVAPRVAEGELVSVTFDWLDESGSYLGLPN